jgi:hypothetical protein
VGDEIMFESIEIIQGGLIQIDIKNVTKNTTERCFMQPSELFKLFGDAMQRSHDKWIQWIQDLETI